MKRTIPTDAWQLIVGGGVREKLMVVRPYQVIIVCSGNTCRSPMAEGILKKALAERGAENVAIISAGTLGLVDSPATPSAVEVARSFAVDISQHRSQSFTPELAQQSDLILALAEEHYQTALEYRAENVFMLKTFPRRTKDLRGSSIRDPIGGDGQMYQRAFLEIDDALQQGVNEIMRRAAQKNQPPEQKEG